MPIRGAILIFVVAILFAIPFRNEIYDWIQRTFPDDKNKEEKDIYEEIEE